MSVQVEAFVLVAKCFDFLCELCHLYHLYLNPSSQFVDVFQKQDVLYGHGRFVGRVQCGFEHFPSPELVSIRLRRRVLRDLVVVQGQALFEVADPAVFDPDFLS